MNIESIADLASRHVRDWIITGEFQPGQQIKEEEVSHRLHISRPPVREALKMLEIAGLVVRKPRRGVFVPEMTDRDMWEVYTLKATLYEMATDLAMDVITAKEIKKLESFLVKMETCVEKTPLDVLRYQSLHRDFHETIMVLAGNERLRAFASNLDSQVSRFSFSSLQDSDHVHSSVRYHRQIVNAIKGKNKSLACRLMREHVLNALKVLINMPDLKAGATDHLRICSREEESV
jgi:DNA-binding GntR family transcriptional regulator